MKKFDPKAIYCVLTSYENKSQLDISDNIKKFFDELFEKYEKIKKKQKSLIQYVNKKKLVRQYLKDEKELYDITKIFSTDIMPNY